MKLTIDYNFNDGTYDWELYDGPNGIDHYTGKELDLGQVFEEVVRRRTLNALSYVTNPHR